ncbi:MAG: hypothetical protein D6775_10620 [Caldilineae bacterium]|nr:MAG: hypothetical protein D6775_10620 [Caldilineae bacterium]
MEAWEKVLVDRAKFLEQDVHAQIGCIECHGGTPETDDKSRAHEGMVAKAGANPQQACGGCHKDYALAAQANVHRLLNGYQDVLKQRGADFTDPTLTQAYGNHCTSCHADCGDCHISRPAGLGGGLLTGHKVKRMGSVWLTCGGCHSARIADDYRGNHEGIPGDVHWEKKGMICTTCHDTQDYHAPGHGNRYTGEPSPACVDCHEDVRPGDGIEQHDEEHLDKLACQVCHSVGAYKSCFGCHTGIDDKGLKYFTTEPSQMTFKIGLNPLQSEERPWQWVLLRHAPATSDLFGFYGEDLLPNFDAVPTWKYTTPHNIRAQTPQNVTCNACHGQEDLFLLETDVDPILRAANRSVIVPRDRVPQYLPDYPAPAEREEGP